MTITLTREEAQQVLDALYSMNGTEFLCQAAHHPKKDMHKSGEVCPVAARYMEARETLRARLSAPEPSIVEDAIVYGTGITKGGKRIAPDSIYKEPEPEPVRLRRGDTLRCIETNELCTVWATSTTGKTQVKWKANDFGSYTAEQIGDLFWVEPKPEPEPVAWMNESDMGRTDWKVWAHGKPTATIPLYAAPPQREWQGLTDEEMLAALVESGWQYRFRVPPGFKSFAKTVDAKLREKNNAVSI
jgi:hypothetical protein